MADRITWYTPGQGPRWLEGGWETSSRSPMFTREMYLRGEAPYVTGATKNRADFKTRWVVDPLTGQPIPVRATDSGPWVRGLDIATEHGAWGKSAPETRFTTGANDPWTPPGALPGASDWSPEPSIWAGEPSPESSPAEYYPSASEYNPTDYGDTSFSQDLLSNWQDYGGNTPTSEYQPAIPTNEYQPSEIGLGDIQTDNYTEYNNPPTDEYMQPEGPADYSLGGENLPTDEAMQPAGPADYSMPSLDTSSDNYTSPAYTGDMSVSSPAQDYGNLPVSGLGDRPGIFAGIGGPTDYGGFGEPMGYFGVPSQNAFGSYGVGGEGGSFFGSGSSPFVGGAFASPPGGISLPGLGQGSSGDISTLAGRLAIAGYNRGDPSLGFGPGSAIYQFAANSPYRPPIAGPGVPFLQMPSSPGMGFNPFGPNSRQMGQF